MRSPKKRIQTKYRMQVLMRVLPNSAARARIYEVADSVTEKFPGVTCFTELDPNDLS